MCSFTFAVSGLLFDVSITNSLHNKTMVNCREKGKEPKATTLTITLALFLASSNVKKQRKEKNNGSNSRSNGNYRQGACFVRHISQEVSFDHSETKPLRDKLTKYE